jgi:hypothetical protein
MTKHENIDMQTRPDPKDARSDGGITGIAGVDPATNPGGYYEYTGGLLRPTQEDIGNYLHAFRRVVEKAKAWRADPPVGKDCRDLVCDLRDAVDELLRLENKP